MRTLRRLNILLVAALILAGTFLGVRNGAETARQDAQARYLAAVAPNVLR